MNRFQIASHLEKQKIHPFFRQKRLTVFFPMTTDYIIKPQITF